MNTLSLRIANRDKFLIKGFARRTGPRHGPTERLSPQGRTFKGVGGASQSWNVKEDQAHLGYNIQFLALLLDMDLKAVLFSHS